LWLVNWRWEWIQAYFYALDLMKPKVKTIPFDPVSLSKNITCGYERVGKASKIGKAKKITKIVTIGVPVFFSRFIYYEHLPAEYPYKLYLSDEDRKKMGVKRKRNLKRKK